jgi:tetratricopeptide (TPR) repeat protein
MTRYFFALISILNVAWAAEGESTVPVQLEARYQRAVVAFNSERFSDALRQIEALLGEAPNNVALRELRALNLKALGRARDALSAYADLVKSGPAASRAKYRFESGEILHGLGHLKEARTQFELSLAADFNTTASRYFLGVIDFEQQQWDDAISKMASVLIGDVPSLKPLAEFYMGMARYNRGQNLSALRLLRYSRDELDEQSPARAKVAENFNKVASEANATQWFANVSFLTAYDNNVPLLPPTINSPQVVGGKRTLKQVLTGAAGATTSPSKTVQVTAAYRGYFNWNDNPDARTFDFFGNAPAVFVTINPSKRLSPGLALQGAYTLQNLAGPGEIFKYTSLSLTGDLGPFVRYELMPLLSLQLDGSYRPKKYYNDPDQGNDRRSGSGYFARLSAQYTSPKAWLNPGVNVNYEKDNTLGLNWRFTAWSFGFSNTAKLGERDTLVATFDATFSKFSQRVPIRTDTYLTPQLTWTHSMNQHLGMLAQATYWSLSSSDAALFSYNRAVVGLGFTYSR